ncbi:MAG: hypothetical protein ACR2QQ_06160 [Gammaproteobacteria bacterium]
MRLLGLMLFGFIVGVVLVAVGIYFNPFTADSGVIAGVNTRVLSYGSPFSDGIAITHNGRTRLSKRPQSIPELWEETISDSMLSVMVLHDQDDVPIGVASRVSQFSESSEMLTRGIIVDDDWLITLAGEGSFYVDADSNLWPFLKETLIPVWYLDRPWEGPKNYRPTSGPGEGGSAIVTGATGGFLERQGTAVESYQISGFDKERGPGEIDARFFLQWSDTTTSLAAE